MLRLKVSGPKGLGKRIRKLLGFRQRGIETFASFRSYLPRLLNHLNPRHTLEFGPGISSKLILDHSRSEILSFETNREYFERILHTTRDERFVVEYAPHGVDFSKLSDRQFDFIFVDGGDRVINLTQSHSLLDPNGMVLLHDAHREDYLDGVRKYSFGYFIENHSLLLFKNRARYHEVKRCFPPQDSCCCHYCGSQERVAYRHKLSQELDAGQLSPASHD